IGSEGSTRSSQTNYGLLTNKAIASAWPNADAYVFNSGSLRIDDDINGTITAFDVLRSFPYGGPLVRMKIDGKGLKEVLSIGDNNRGEGGYLQRYLAEDTGNEWQINGKPIDDKGEYVIVLPQFLAEGKEAKLEFLADYFFLTQDSFELNGQTIKNDIRDIVITYLAGDGR
ncbi:MAG: 5'-nucleotidase, partial [Bacteroidota bacterium]